MTDKLQELVNKISQHMPVGYELSLHIEHGSAWVELHTDHTSIDLPDSADKTLVEQLNDALRIANGWTDRPTAEGG